MLSLGAMYEGNRRNTMQALVVACFVAVAIAVGAAAVLDNFVQESSPAAFTEPSARI
jgi:FlaG/FlaF family flagellin (archaellin)